jgi:flagellar hook protein FlgE
MMRGMFAAISGLKNHQMMLDVTANDIANVNTIGYKSARTTFADSLTQTQRGASGAGGGTGGANAAQIGLGVKLGSIDNLMTTGAMQSTGNPLDVAIEGPGFFRVATSSTNPPTANPLSATDAGVEYTRAGNFTTNSDGYLVTQDGYYVQGLTTANGTTPTLIKIPDDATNIAIGKDGAVSYVDNAGARQQAGYLSGNAQIDSPGANVGTTTPGMIEMSNVDLAQAFTNMITAQRGFQANSRVISTSDQMLQDLVNLKN